LLKKVIWAHDYLFSNFLKKPRLIFYNIIWIDVQEENRLTDAIQSQFVEGGIS